MDSLEDWKLLFGMAATLIGGLWTVFVYFDKKRSAPAERAKAEAPAAAGRPVPPLPLMLVAGGLALVAASILFAAKPAVSVSNECGAAAGGSISGSVITADCETND